MPQCAACGRGDLMQAQIRTYQCLACGSVMDEQQNVLPTQVKGPNLSNAGLPVKELGDTAEVVLAPVVETAPEAPVEAVETPEPEIEPVDLSNLSPEQLAEIQAIIHPEVSNGETDDSPAQEDQPQE